jgi:hypothetical protein
VVGIATGLGPHHLQQPDSQMGGGAASAVGAQPYNPLNAAPFYSLPAAPLQTAWQQPQYAPQAATHPLVAVGGQSRDRQEMTQALTAELRKLQSPSKAGTQQDGQLQVCTYTAMRRFGVTLNECMQRTLVLVLTLKAACDMLQHCFGADLEGSMQQEQSQS